MLYSLVARWRAELGCGASAAMRFWFGSRALGLPLVAPKVGIVARRLPLRCGLDAEGLAENHTLLPYYSGFMAADGYERARSSTLTAGVLRLPITVGCSTRGSARMLFCPECALDDIRNVRAATWRREHHIPGVLVCPEHGCPLRAGGLAGDASFPSLVTPPIDLIGPEVENPFPGDGANRLARLARELADRSRPPAGKRVMAARYRRLLRGSGYLYGRGSVRAERLRADLIRFYGERGLDSLGRGPGARDPFAWLGLLASDTSPHGGTPLPLLLVIGMLDCSWREFEEPFRDGAPARRGPRLQRFRTSRTASARLPGFKDKITAFISANPAASRNAVLLALRHAYLFVQDVDRPWLESVLPAATNARSGPPTRDADKDARCLRMVKDAIARERAKSGPPDRMGLLWLRRAAGLPRRSVSGDAERIPMTDAFMRFAAEGIVDFRKRKVVSTADAVRLSGATPAWPEFVRLAVGGAKLPASERAAARLLYDGLPLRPPAR